MIQKVNGPTSVNLTGMDLNVVRGYESPVRPEYKSSILITTASDLQTAMGSPPKTGFKIFGMLVRASTDYKNVMDGLDLYQRAYAEVANAPLGFLPKTAFKDLETTLQKIITDANQYCTTHQNEPKKAGRIAIMQRLAGQAVNEMHALREFRDNHTDRFPPKVTFGEGRSLTEHKIPGDIVSSTLSSKTLEGEPEPLGKGAVNSVFVATYRLEDETVETRVLKPLTKSKEKDQRVGPECLTGIDASELKIAQRNVASASVASLLGQPGLIPRPEVVIHNSQAYLAMPKANGEDGVVPKLNVTDIFTNAGRSQEDSIARGDATPEDFAGNGLVLVGKDENNQSIYGKYEDCARNLPYRSDVDSDTTASLQQQLLDLQVIDLICGQTDRTPRNYLVKVGSDAVTVTGIDNDCSFGVEPDVLIELNNPHNPVTQPWPGLPPVISKTMFDNLTALTPAVLRQQLQADGLNPREIHHAVVRLGQLQDHARDLMETRHVVENFKTWREPDTGRTMSQVLGADKNPNYVKQMIEVQSDSIKTFGELVPLEQRQHL